MVTDIFLFYLVEKGEYNCNFQEAYFFVGLTSYSFNIDKKTLVLNLNEQKKLHVHYVIIYS